MCRWTCSPSHHELDAAPLELLASPLELLRGLLASPLVLLASPLELLASPLELLPIAAVRALFPAVCEAADQGEGPSGVCQGSQRLS